MLATLVGVAVITVPWWVRLVRDLGEERSERIREAEQAEIAAHLHDSVLQTLALIQRQSDGPARWRGWPAGRSASCARGSTGRAGTGVRGRVGVGIIRVEIDRTLKHRARLVIRGARLIDQTAGAAAQDKFVSGKTGGGLVHGPARTGSA